MAESVGTFDRLWVSSDDVTYTALEFLDGSTLGAQETFLDTSGTRGTRQHTADRVRRSQRQVGGTLRFAPVATELDLLLPPILGADENADVFALAETLPARYLMTGRDGTYHKYTGVKVNRATFSFSENGPLTLDAEVAGVDEEAGSLQADAIDDDAGPYVLSDCVLTVGGSQYAFRAGSITVDNFLAVKYNNSVTPSSITAADLQVQVSLTLPYGDAAALYGTAVTGVAVAAAFTNGNRSITFNLAGVAAPRQPLPLGGKGPRDLAWVGVARRTGSTPPISVTNDSSG